MTKIPWPAQASPLFERRWFAPVVYFAIAMAVYSNAISTPFVFDDLESIVDNRSLMSFPVRQVWQQQRGFAYWTLSWNRAIFQLDPPAYHITNIAIHALAALSLFGTVQQTLRHSNFDDRLKRDASAIAGIAGLIWLVHPLNTESVTYTIQRTESLMGCLALFGLYCLAHSPWTKRAWPWLLVSVVAVALGSRTKEAMIAVPILYVWYDRTFLSRSWKELLRRRGWYYAAIAVLWTGFYGSLVLQAANVVGLPNIAFTAASQDHVEISPAGQEMGIAPGLTPVRYLAAQPAVIAHYLWLAIWPDRLCIDYVWPLPDSTWQVAIPGTAIVLGIGLSAWLAWSRPAWGFLCGWFWINLAPRSSLLPRSDLAVEHRMYLPLAALAVAATLIGYWLIRKLPEWLPAARRHKSPAWIGGITVLLTLVALGIRTRVRNDDFQSAERLWRSTLAIAPENPRAMTNLGLTLFESGRTDEAIEWYRRAILQESLLEYDQIALFNLGNAMLHQKRLPEAELAFKEAVSIAPNFGPAHNNLAFVHLQLGTNERAREHAGRAVELIAEHPGARLNLGVALRRLGQLAEAELQLRRALALDPGSAAAQHQLGMLLADLGNPREALSCFDEALALDKSRWETHGARADLLRGQGRFDAAVESRRLALDSKPDDPQLAIELARDLAAGGKHDKARGVLSQVISREPDNLDAKLVLGDVAAASGDWSSAIEQYREAKASHPTDERPFRKLATACEALQQWDAARAELEAAVAVAPRSETAIGQLAEFFLRTKELPQAVETCERGLAIYPNSCRLLTTLGIALESSGDIRRASNAFSQAVALDHRYSPARTRLAACLTAEGKLSEAAAQYEALLELNPRDQGAHNNLANVLARSGQFDGAISHYQQALAIDPEFQLARENLQRVRALQSRP